MKFKARRKVANVLEPIVAIGTGGFGGMMVCAVTDAYCDSCGFGKAAKVALSALSAVAAAPIAARITSDSVTAIEDWVHSAPDYDPRSAWLKELEDDDTQEETEAE